MVDVLQCPFCELRFTSRRELQDHIALDHPDRTVPERRYGGFGARSAVGGVAVRRADRPLR